MPEQMTDAGAPQGLSWSWQLDFDALMAAIAGAGPSLPGASAAVLPVPARSRPARLPSMTRMRCRMTRTARRGRMARRGPVVGKQASGRAHDECPLTIGFAALQMRP